VDLAGSERVAKTRSEGLLLREAGAINKSLALLEQVCVWLGEGVTCHARCTIGICRFNSSSNRSLALLEQM
jgi:hypothetical protein